MGMNLEYDDTGTTFYYFLLSLFAIFLLPITYIIFKRTKHKPQLQGEETEERDVETLRCQCPPCQRKEESLVCSKADVKSSSSRNLTGGFVARAFVVVLWALLVAGVVKVSQFERVHKEYNPYDILGIDRGSSDAEIKKAGRELSRIHHPDRGGTSEQFIAISKAVKALTDPVAKENWDKYGNPDGPGAAVWGVALPAWLVDEKFSNWVLGIYMFIVLVVAPTAAGMFWYRHSLNASTGEVNKDTKKLYYQLFQQTPTITLLRIIALLGGSAEFRNRKSSRSGSDDFVVEREGDAEELAALVDQLEDLNVKGKEIQPYSLKARTLLHAHFTRFSLPENTLQKDLEVILKKCPMLLNEMVSIVSQLIVLGKLGHVAVAPRVETLEHVIRLMQMVTQGVWASQSVFLMLPHVTEEHLRHFSTKKRNVKTLRQFVEMDGVERRLLLRTLSDQEYQDVLCVSGSLPLLQISVKANLAVEDEEGERDKRDELRRERDDKEHEQEAEDSVISCGSTVAVTVTLTRKSLAQHLNDGDVSSRHVTKDEEQGEEEEEEEGKKTSTWQRKSKKGKGAKKPTKKQPSKKKKKQEEDLMEDESADPVENQDQGEDAELESKPNCIDDVKNDTDENSLNGDDALKTANSATSSTVSKEKGQEGATPLLRAPLVHAPHFPMEKREMWWLYIVLSRTNELRTLPQQVCIVKDEHEVVANFSAPDKCGTYEYTVVVRSDSYLDVDATKTFTIEVEEAKEFDPGAHWDIPSSEEGENGDSDSGESVYETEEEADEE